MLGPSKSRDLDRPVLASLETLVPQDHFYRHLDVQLDLSFVREWVKERPPGSSRLKGRSVLAPMLGSAAWFWRANQACQQKENAQQNSCQCRRMAR
jgi:hypothetical protein